MNISAYKITSPKLQNIVESFLVLRKSSLNIPHVSVAFGVSKCYVEYFTSLHDLIKVDINHYFFELFMKYATFFSTNSQRAPKAFSVVAKLLCFNFFTKSLMDININITDFWNRMWP